MNKFSPIDPFQSPLEWLLDQTKDFGPPVDLDDERYASYLEGLGRTYDDSTEADEKFYFVINLQNLQLEYIQGLQKALGHEEEISLEGFFQLVHPEYMEAYLMWAVSAYQVAFQNRELVIPLRQSYRITIPIRHRNGKYYWYSQHVTAIRIDAEGHIVCQLNTYYYEGEWSRFNIRPFEACLSQGNQQSPSWERQLNTHMATNFLLDRFRNSEIELLRLYAEGHQTASEIMAVREGWSKHVIYEYNKNILQKAHRVTRFEFREAKDVALYFREKGYI